MEIKKKLFLLSFFILLAIAGLSFGLTGFDFANAQGGTQTKLYGSAWSSNIGWISFNNCKINQNGSENCVGQNYNVQAHGLTGNLTGSAWSSNIGWIKFGGLSGFPVGNGTESGNGNGNAKIIFSTGKVQGWARACAGTQNGDCSNMTSRADGWDGWISLSGSLHPSPTANGTGGVTYLSGPKKLVGSAWGGPVVGWIYFGGGSDDWPNVWYGPVIPPDEPEEFDFSLSNSGHLNIEQGKTGGPSVIATYISGSEEEITFSVAPEILDGGKIQISLGSNSCQLGPAPLNSCSKSVTISVDSDATINDYSVNVTVISDSGVERVNTLNFSVIEPIPPDPVVEKCFAVDENDLTRKKKSLFYIYEQLFWWVEIDSAEEGEEGPIFHWSVGSDGLSDVSGPVEEGCPEGKVCSGIPFTYTTVGPKTARVSIFGPEGNFEPCEITFIGAKVFFREI